MSTRLKDGSFTPIEEFANAFETFNEMLEKDEALSFHVGSEAEILKQQAELSLTERLNEIEKRVDNIDNDPFKKAGLELPTIDEICRLQNEQYDESKKNIFQKLLGK